MAYTPKVAVPVTVACGEVTSSYRSHDIGTANPTCTSVLHKYDEWFGFSDITLRCSDGVGILAHRIMLVQERTGARLFRDLLTSATLPADGNLSVEETSAEMQLLMDYIYKQIVPEDFSSHLPLVVAALKVSDKYNQPQLLEKALQALYQADIDKVELLVVEQVCFWAVKLGVSFTRAGTIGRRLAARIAEKFIEVSPATLDALPEEALMQVIHCSARVPDVKSAVEAYVQRHLKRCVKALRRMSLADARSVLKGVTLQQLLEVPPSQVDALLLCADDCGLFANHAPDVKPAPAFVSFVAARLPDVGRNIIARLASTTMAAVMQEIILTMAARQQLWVQAAESVLQARDAGAYHGVAVLLEQVRVLASEREFAAKYDVEGRFLAIIPPQPLGEKPKKRARGK